MSGRWVHRTQMSGHWVHRTQMSGLAYMYSGPCKSCLVSERACYLGDSHEGEKGLRGGAERLRGVT